MIATHWPELLVFGGGVLWLVAQLIIFAWIEKPGSRADTSGQSVAAKTSTKLGRFWRKPWLRAGALRAVLETLLFQLGLTACLLCLGLSLPASENWQIIASLVILDGPYCILWCALRLHLPGGAWWRQILYEGALAVALGFGLLPLLLVTAFTTVLLKGNLSNVPREMFSFPALLGEGMEHSQELLRILVLIFVGVLILFLTFRV